MSRTLSLDLHTHLKVAKRAPYRPADTERYAQAMRRRGLDGLAIAEHAHGAELWEMYHALAARYPYRKGRFEIDGGLFYPGMELTLAEHVDIIFIAPVEELSRLDGAFPERPSCGYHPDAEELADALDLLRLDAIRIAAHPARQDKHLIDRVPASLLERLLDAVEINACYVEPELVADTRGLAHALGLPLTAGSDAHMWPQLGAAYTTFEVADDSFDDLRAAVAAGRVEPHMRDDADRLVQAGARLKAQTKRRLPKLERMPWITAESSPVAT